jgi:fatty acid hydroxylase family protein
VAAPATLDQVALRHGLAKKRDNAIVAALCGAIPAVILFHYFPADWHRWVIGFMVGLLWGNGFEYVYHRWLLHGPRSAFGKGHLEHHANVGSPEEPEHVALGKSPPYVALLFTINGIPAILVDYAFGLQVVSGIFVGWAIYLIVAEEIHWRIHMHGWLPPGLRLAAAYHMSHHDIPTSRYNVFLPVFDLLLGSSASRAVRR